MSVKIPLSKGQFAIIDETDFELVNQFKWTATFAKCTGGYYACRRSFSNGKFVFIYLHRFLLNATKGFEVDHKNRNGLDNRRSNIRLATRSQNMANSPPRGIYKGVTYHPKWNRRYSASIRKDNRKTYIGAFSTAEAAAKAYDAIAKEVFGEFAYLNFPEPELSNHQAAL